MNTASVHTAPPCGASRCHYRAAFADASGVGWCAKHQNDGLHGYGCEPADVGDFDPWWAASSIAREMGGAERRRWRGLGYGEWPV